ncbi:circularly permuted type 2 ATP-grasp protein [Quisquiliibacterium transsilvanicum]|uniref:Putative circularly permuted ATP-grasp superfamily protein n=2 Tax=Quisquiliibacterium transsilvanicum TaxID=1549638 RepID=A0A7W8M8F4_9BURK|nr:putative circularly permuted ATP-grasp superfamily protein [Quisquiliibacterium transsilvanicum]
MTAHPLTPIAPPQGIYDEMLDEAGQCREHYRACGEWLASMGAEAMAAKRAEADLIFRRTGITFTVYGEEGGSERLIPSDVVPRIIPADDWALLERGLVQRVTAINRFLADIYHGREILRAGLIPAEDVLENDQYQPAMIGARLPHDTYAHIAGVDLVRHSDGAFYVLEDNLRVPSGVSYLLSNRRTMMRLFPDLFRRYQVRPVEHYPALLLHTLRAATEVDSPTVVLLTPGRYNSAYFEHAFLAQQMGIELVEGQDLFVRDSCVWMRTTSGPQRVDVIYRRLDDTFLDPLVFRPDSTLGVPGLMAAYRAGNVVIANAIGTGVADDKSIYPYVPEMIRFYLGEEPLLRNVPTWICRRPEDLAYVLAHLPELVVKEVHGAGGYGMLVGPTSTAAEIENFRRALVANPGNYIAQPTLALSTCPTFVDEGVAPRHIDLRPFVLVGREVRMVAGGLTRVALRRGSLVVNSSQGGGTKDTWVLDAPARGGSAASAGQGAGLAHDPVGQGQVSASGAAEGF